MQHLNNIIFRIYIPTDLRSTETILYVLFMYLQNKINADAHKNRKGNEGKDELEVDRQFYMQLPKDLIRELYDIVYEPDFQMLGYEYPQEYIDMGYS